MCVPRLRKAEFGVDMQPGAGKIFKNGKEIDGIPVFENKTKAKQGKRRDYYEQMEVALEAGWNLHWKRRRSLW